MTNQRLSSPFCARARAYRLIAPLALLCLAAARAAAAPRLGKPDPKVKAALRRVLARKALTASDLPALEAGAGDGDRAVRLDAAGGLGRVQGARAQADLVSLLASDPDAEVRQLAALRLKLYPDAAAVEALVRALERDPSPGVRRQAAWSLLASSSAPAKAALAKAAKDDPDAVVRRTAKLK